MIGCLTSCSDNDETKEYPNRIDSYEIVNSEVGCESKYSKKKKKDIFNQFYKNNWFTWEGEVVLADSDNVSLNVDFFGIQDLDVDFEKKGAGYNLQQGQIIKVKFLMKHLGGCILPFMGEKAIILPR